jgi:hypothetical protein
MPTSFIPADAAIAVTRTLVYTAPASTQSVVFAGTVANIDTTGLLDHLVTIEVQKVDTSFVSVVTQAPISFGGSLSLPKIVLASGEKLYMTADTASKLVTRISVVERT